MYIILFKKMPASNSEIPVSGQRKNTKVVPLTIGSRDVGTLMDSAGSNRPQPGAALVGRELGRHKIQQP